MKKIISRVERLNTRTHAGSLSPQPELVFTKESYQVDNRVLARTVTQTVNPSDRMSKFKVSDFTTENLLAIGAKDHFRPLPSLLSSDIDTSLMSLDSVMDIIDAAEKQGDSNPSLTVPGTKTESVENA